MGELRFVIRARLDLRMRPSIGKWYKNLYHREHWGLTEFTGEISPFMNGFVPAELLLEEGDLSCVGLSASAAAVAGAYYGQDG